MKKTLKPVLTIIALLLVILEIFNLVPAIGNLSFLKTIENYTYLAFYIVLALDAFAYKGSRNTGFGFAFIVLAILLVTGIITIPYEFGLLVTLFYYLMNKNSLYVGILVAFIGIALSSFVHEIIAQLVIIIGLYLYLIKINPKYKLKK
ncbi:hypothetical protein RJG79_12375 [Mycoplasmatota bacterium WC44]